MYRSAYMIFCEDKREAVSAELRASKGSDFKVAMPMVLKKMSELWKTISPDEKDAYEAESSKEKAEYEKQYVCQAKTNTITEPTSA